jgi:farnesyl diphosphate synthase
LSLESLGPGWLDRIERKLNGYITPNADAPLSLIDAMRYSVLGGGKRMRALWVYAAGSAFGAPLEHLDASAAAVEIIHAYSLVHDDLPAMDNDTLRRGKPTCHVQFGEAAAILAGDALQALAFEVLLEHTPDAMPAATRVELARVLARACGASGMAGGQAIDLAAMGAALNERQLAAMHGLKTGALISAAVGMGARAAGVQDPAMLRSLDAYARAAGLAFQIHDDVLDVEGDLNLLGKSIGKDARSAKPTYPSALGLDAAKALAQAECTRALQQLETLGIQRTELHALARYCVNRRS